jgi:hypothetical protein
VIVDKMMSHECAALIEAIHNKINFGRRLYCNGIIPRSPDKTEQPDDTPASSSAGLSTVTPATSTSVSLTDGPSMSPQTTTATLAKTTTTTSLSKTPVMVPTLPSLVSPMSPNTFSQQYSETPDLLHLELSNDHLVRRNSLSLRSPPPGSLADEILNHDTANSDQHYAQAKSILTNLKEMSERYSDFGSCYSSSSGDEAADGFKTYSKKKKGKKHKLSISPGREYFLKKPNLATSPQL